MQAKYISWTLFIFLIFNSDLNSQISPNSFYNPKLKFPIGHTRSVLFATFSPDEKLVVTAGYDHTAKVWDVQSGNLIHDLQGFRSQIRIIEFSISGRQLLTMDLHNNVKVWDVKSGSLLFEFPKNAKESSYNAFCNYSPDGNQIAHKFPDNELRIYDSRTGKLNQTLNSFSENIRSFEYQPNSIRLALLNELGKLSVWDAVEGKEVVKFDSKISKFKYSPSGNYILSISDENSLFIYDTENGDKLHAINLEKNKINTAHFSPNEKQVLIKTRNNIITIYDVVKKRVINSIAFENQQLLLAKYSFNGEYFLTSFEDGTVKIFESRTLKLENTIKLNRETLNLKNPGNIELSGVRMLQCDNTNNYFIAVNSHKYSNYNAASSSGYSVPARADGIAHVFDINSGNLKFELSHGSSISFTQFSPRGNYIITTGGFHAKIWDAKSGRLLHELSGKIQGVGILEIRNDGKQLLFNRIKGGVSLLNLDKGAIEMVIEEDDNPWSAPFNSYNFYGENGNVITSLSNGIAKVWDSNSGKLLQEAKLDGTKIYSSSFGPDGRSLITMSLDSTLSIWNLDAQRPYFTIKDTSSLYSICSMSPDGKRVLTITTQQKASLWDLSTGDQLLIMNSVMPFVDEIKFSPDSKKLFLIKDLDKTSYMTIPDSLILIIDANDGSVLFELNGDSYASGVTFSHDNSKIITYHKLVSWDIKTGNKINILSNDKLPLMNVEYSTDGKYIAAGGRDHIVYVWDALKGEQLYQFKGHSGRVWEVNFSPDNEYLVTSGEDGLIIFWSLISGKELFTFVPLGALDWALLHPSGLFDASPKAMDWMYYLIGREIIELDQLKDRYYEPGLFEKIMAGETIRDVQAFETVAMYPEVNTSIQDHELHILLKERNGGIGKVSVFINNKEVLPDANAGRDTSLTIDLAQFENFYFRDTFNTISVRAYNQAGWLKSGTFDHTFVPYFINRKGDAENDPILTMARYDPHLYAIIVGASDYVGDDLDLQFADKDSKDMASAIEQSSKLLFGTDKVQLNWFTSTGMEGSKPGSKRNIKAAIDSIAAQAKAEDILLFYFSGHGVTYGNSFETEQFYYLTKDMNSGNLSDPEVRNNYAISSDEMTEWINTIAAQKQVMILDACSSGKVVEDLLTVRNVPTSQIRALDRMKDRTGMFVLAGSAADQVSYEASRFGQGLLTYSLLLGMNGSALKDGQTVDVMQLFQFARDQVPEFAEDIGGVQKPTLSSPLDASSFDIGVVDETIDIPLQEVKPLFTRSNFQDEEQVRDVIQLSKALDNLLANTSSGPASRGAIFIDVDQYKNAWSLNGRYKLNNDQVEVQVSLFKGEEMKQKFKISESKSKVKKLAEKIINEASRQIKDLNH